VAMTQMFKQAMLEWIGYGIALESLGMMAGVGTKKE